METGELRYYHSSQNNSRFFDVPHLIRTEEDLEKFLDELQGQDILEYIRQRHWSSMMYGQASEKAIGLSNSLLT
jgi:TRAP-type C4-dicarboxylate transport system substrate-binding protein